MAGEQVFAAEQLIQVRYRPGFRYWFTQGAHGLAILAFVSDALRESALAEYDTSRTLRRRLQGIRQAGYAVTHDEVQFGAAGIAAPVFVGRQGPVCGSLGIVTPVNRFPAGKDAVNATLRAAQSVTERLA